MAVGTNFLNVLKAIQEQLAPFEGASLGLIEQAAMQALAGYVAELNAKIGVPAPPATPTTTK